MKKMECCEYGTRIPNESSLKEKGEGAKFGATISNFNIKLH
jgi:hypothetical protein